MPWALGRENARLGWSGGKAGWKQWIFDLIIFAHSPQCTALYILPLTSYIFMTHLPSIICIRELIYFFLLAYSRTLKVLKERFAVFTYNNVNTKDLIWDNKYTVFSTLLVGMRWGLSSQQLTVLLRPPESSTILYLAVCELLILLRQTNCWFRAVNYKL